MAKNLTIQSTDSELDQRLAALQPYNTVQLTIVTAAPSVQREDRSIEHTPEDIQNLEGLVPGRELRENMLAYRKRIEGFKEQFPDFEKYVGQDIPIPLSVRDEILRQPNGPDIALFLGFAPDVIEQLCKMHPLDAAKCIESIGEDLERASVPREDADQTSSKAAQNSAKKALRPRKP
jgi:hypothetical protein